MSCEIYEAYVVIYVFFPTYIDSMDVDVWVRINKRYDIVVVNLNAQLH